MNEGLQRRSEELRRSVRESEEELHVAVAQMEKASADSLHLGVHVARHPWHWLGGACLVGVAIGLFTSTRSD